MNTFLKLASSLGTLFAAILLSVPSAHAQAGPGPVPPLPNIAFPVSSRSYPFRGDAVYSASATVTCTSGSTSFTIDGVTVPSTAVGAIMTVGLCGGGGSATQGTVTAVSGDIITLDTAAGTTLAATASYVAFGHDDSVAMQAMLTAGAGGNIYLAGGKSYMIATVGLLSSHTHLYCGPGATLVMPNGFSGSVPNHYLLTNLNHNASGFPSGDSDIWVDGCAFEGSATTPSTGADGVRLVFVDGARITNSDFHDFGDAIANVGSQHIYENGNRAYNITNTCWDNWWGWQYLTIGANNHCESHKHGIQMTGTDSTQTLPLVSSYASIYSPDITLLADSTGAGIWMNSGMNVAGNAGVQHAQVFGGHITALSTTASGAGIKVTGTSTGDIQVFGTQLNNAEIGVTASDVVNAAASAAHDVHFHGVGVHNINDSAGAAVTIAFATNASIDSSSLDGTMRYGVNLASSNGAVVKNNAITGGTAGRENIGSATNYVVDDTAISTGILSLSSPTVVSLRTRTGLTALAGGGQSGATALTTGYNKFSTVATAGDSAILTTGAAGDQIIVSNAGAASMNVFPASGGTIGTAAANTALAVAPGTVTTFYCTAANTWDSK